MKVTLKILKAEKIYAPVQIDELDEKRIVPNMMLRRRLTRNAKIMLYLADKCSYNNNKVVYGSAYGELQASTSITEAILREEQISPTLFQNSVYNTAPSYFSLLHSDRDEIITVSSGKNTSYEALRTAALQALISQEPVLCVVTECINIQRIEEVNTCSSYLEAGAAVVIDVIEEDSTKISELKESDNKKIMESLKHIWWIAENKNGEKFSIEL